MCYLQLLALEGTVLCLSPYHVYSYAGWRRYAGTGPDSEEATEAGPAVGKVVFAATETIHATPMFSNFATCSSLMFRRGTSFEVDNGKSRDQCKPKASPNLSPDFLLNFLPPTN
jgi:hypothetical protein